MSSSESPLLKRLKIAGGGSSSHNREICSYGLKCYRRNIHHLLEFAHPKLEEVYATMVKCGNFDELPPNTDITDKKVFLEQITILRKAKFQQTTPDTISLTDKPPTPKQNVGISAENCKPIIDETSSSSSSSDEKRRNFVGEGARDLKQASTSSLTVLEKWEKTVPFNYFLTKVSRIHEEKGVFSVSFGDLFDSSFGKVKALCHINFMMEANWLIEESLKAGLDGVPTWLICGVESLELQEAAATFPWLKVFGMKSPFPYGHHHTKMTIVQYVDLSVRFMVYTANLIDSDWEDRTQGVWISPSCPRQEGREGGDSETKFKTDFIQYLQTYPVKVHAAWVDVLRHTDCSAIKVYFVASAPVTTQSPTNGFQWGTKKVERIIKSLVSDKVEADWSLVVQCSSIGTLGSGAPDWLQGELGKSMAGGDRVEGAIHVVYPSHLNVKDSFDGLHGGGCLPYSAMTHMKQTWLQKHLCQWKANCSGRTRAVPHIKSYCRISPDSTRMAWFLLTSANLSKAAWGKLNKKRDRLSVMSWEAGVLFAPQLLIGKDEFKIGVQNYDHESSFPVHIDLPVTKYREQDKPWFFETLANLQKR